MKVRSEAVQMPFCGEQMCGRSRSFMNNPG
jgi:hypothetical protein